MPPSPPDPTIVAGRFEILDLAGEGGMGAVYRARDLLRGGQVALKLLREQRLASTSAERRMERESWALEELSHAGIVAHVDHGTTEGGEPYLAMEWLEGGTLATRLAEGPLSIEDAVTIAAQVAAALGAAHALGMTHRDLKPGNVFLCEGRPDRVKVFDFGLVRRVDLQSSLTRGNLIGTPAYMAPEQARGRSVDARADVFSLGCVLFECLAGRRPFDAPTLPALLLEIMLEPPPRLDRLRPEVPSSLIALVERMLSKSPDDRPADGSAVALALAEIQRLSTASSVQVPRRGDVGLTQSEQRFRCVIMMMAPEHPSATGEEPATLVDTHAMHLSVRAEAGATRERPAGDVALEKLRSVADRHGAELDRMFDGTLVVTFAGGGTAKDVAARAARCALAMRAVAPSTRIALAAGWGVPRDRGSRSGDSSEAAKSSLGGKEAITFTSTGENVIRVNALIAELLGRRFDVPSVDGRRFLLGERAEADGGGPFLGHVSPFVGRAREMATLESLLAECCDERVARAVLVTGEAGMGKSRLCVEFLRRARERAEVEIWVASGDALSEGSAFALLAQTIRGAAGIREGEPIETRRAKLAARVARDLPEDARDTTTALLGEIAGSPFPAGVAPILRALRQDPAAMGEQMRAAWSRWLGAAVAERPTLIVLEDLHWGDLPTVKLLDDALGQQRERPLMVLALARPEVRTKFPELWARRDVQEIRLAALTRKACEALVQEALGNVDADVAARLAERAQGNAFFLEELIRAVASGASDALPETVLAMLQRRIESQSPMVRHLLRAASVFGRDFWDDGVAALVGASRRQAEVRYDLVALVEGELLSRVEDSRFPGSREYRFRHDLVGDAVYATLTDDDRTLGHRLAAAWLAEKGERDPLVLAGHHERGGELREAAALYQQAADEAVRADDPAATLRHVASARRCGATGELAGRACDAAASAWWRLGRFDETEREALAAMAALPRASAEWHRAAMLVVITRSWTGRVAELAEPLAELRTELDAPIAAWHLIAWAGVCGTMFRLGRNEDALLFVERVERRAGEVGPDEAPLHIVRHYRAYFWSHEPEVAVLEAEAAASILERAGEPGTRDTLVIAAADCAVTLGAVEEGERSLRAWLAAADDRNHLGASAKLSLARALFWQSRHDEALAVARQALERAVAVKHRLREGQLRCVIAQILTAGGDTAGAMREAQRAVELLAYSVVSHPQALAVVASVHLAAGDVADALVAARAAHRKMTANSVVNEIEAEVRLTYAEALHAAGERADALAAIADARDRLLARAATITREPQRRRFLSAVPTHARTLALASEWQRL